MTTSHSYEERVAELRADQLMQPNPVSVNESATLQCAARFLIDRHFTAAPVIDDAGRPQGVISLTDIARYDSQSGFPKLPVDDYYDRTILTLQDMKKWEGFDFSTEARVRDAMTPVVLAVAPETCAAEVIKLMLERNIHRLFVKNAAGILVGIITAFDVLRQLTK